MIEPFPSVGVYEAVSALGDSTLLLPLSVATAVLLWVRRSPAMALAWAAPLALCLAGLMGLKVLGHACEPEVLGAPVVSPSGHAAFGAAFYGSLGLMAGRGLGGWRRPVLLLALAALVAAVAATRVLLEQHSVPEVLAGLAIGAAATLASGWALARVAVPQGARPAPAMTGPAAALAVLALPLLVLVLSGHRLRTEQSIHDFALRLRADTALCASARALARRSVPGELDMPARLH